MRVRFFRQGVTAALILACFSSPLAVGLAQTAEADPPLPTINDSPPPEVPSPKPALMQTVTGEIAPVAAPLDTTYAGDRLTQAASTYGSFQSDVTRYSRSLNSEAEIDEALRALGTHNHQKLSEGWIAYAALIAAQSPTFAAEVRKVDDFYGRERMLLGMRNDRGYVRQLDGAQEALDLAISAAQADARRLNAAGEKIKEQAYSLQGLAWAKETINKTTRNMAQGMKMDAVQGRPALASVRALFESRSGDDAVRRAGEAGAPSLWDSFSSVSGSVAFPETGLSRIGRNFSVRPVSEGTANRIATLAAYRILGETSSVNVDVDNALNDPIVSECLNMSQLQLMQCVSATYKVYERPFCIGEHALMDVGKCVGRLAN